MNKHSVLNKEVIKKGLEFVEASKKDEFEKKWKKLQVLEAYFHRKRAELVYEQTKTILEAYGTSNP